MERRKQGWTNTGSEPQSSLPRDGQTEDWTGVVMDGWAGGQEREREGTHVKGRLVCHLDQGWLANLPPGSAAAETGGIAVSGTTWV